MTLNYANINKKQSQKRAVGSPDHTCSKSSSPCHCEGFVLTKPEAI